MHERKQEDPALPGADITAEAVVVHKGSGFGKDIGARVARVPFFQGAGNSASRENPGDLLPVYFLTDQVEYLNHASGGEQIIPGKAAAIDPLKRMGDRL